MILFVRPCVSPLPGVQLLVSKSTLNECLAKQDWKSAIHQINTRAGKRELLTQDVQGILPLHHACHYGAPLEVIKRMIHYYPGSASRTLKDGRTPLHIASYSNAPLEVIKTLIRAYPKALETTENTYGRLPLHFAISTKSSEEVVHEVLNQFPNGAQPRDYFGCLPLHLALYEGAPMSTILSLLRTNMKATTVFDNQGWLPIHIAVLHRAPIDVIYALLEAFPKGAATRDKCRNLLPIDVALNEGSEEETVEALMLINPTC